MGINRPCFSLFENDSRSFSGTISGSISGTVSGSVITNCTNATNASRMSQALQERTGRTISNIDWLDNFIINQDSKTSRFNESPENRRRMLFRSMRSLMKISEVDYLKVHRSNKQK